MDDYLTISNDEENQNNATRAERTRDEDETLGEITRVRFDERTGSRQDGNVCCWKCLTSEYFLFGVPALPITFAVLVISALVVNYAIAVSLEHVAPFLPYVSWLASNIPEQYIFDFMMSLATINVAFIIYFKYKIIADNYQGPHVLAVLAINKTCAWIGLLSSLLFLMSSTFAAIANKSIQEVHDIASISAFSLLCIYFIIETVMSFKIQYRVHRVTLAVSITRAVFAALSPACLIVCGVTGNLSYKKLEKGANDKKWSSSDGGYALHVTAAFFEWSLVLFMVAFFLTYVSELSEHVTEVKITCKEKNARVEEI